MYPKQCRLLKRSDFMRCYDGGTRRHSGHFIFFILPTMADMWRFGAAVSRKVGGAVQRNRIKRLLREFFRLHQHAVPHGVDIVAVAKKGVRADALRYQELEQELLSLLTGLNKATGKSRVAGGTNETASH